MNSQKGFVIPLIIAIVAILAIGGGVFVTQNNKAEAPVISNTSDWKTYVNTKYGFEFKYPLNWEIVDTKGGPIVSVAPNGYKIKEGTESFYGSFFVWPFGFNLSEGMKIKRLNMPLDTGWVDDFGGKIRQVITEDKKLEITMVGGGTIVEQILKTFSFTSPTPIVGGDKDEHGCISSAGYSWCAVKNKCLRVWEEKCEVAPISTTTNSVVCTMDAMMCPDGTYVGRSAPDCKFICPSVSDKCVEGDVKRYTCPNGSQVNWCGCSETGSFTCIISPEAKCN